MKFIAQKVQSDQVKFTPRLLSEMALAADVIRRACVLDDGKIRPDDVIGMAGKALTQLSSTGEQRTLAGINTSRSSRYEDSQSVSALAVIAVALGGLVLLIFGLHFFVIAMRIIYRGRRKCAVPASLNVLAKEVDGTIALIGIYGCIFRPSEQNNPDETPMIAEGTYTDIAIGDLRLNSRVTSSLPETHQLWFTQRLDRRTLRQIVDQSTMPRKFDFSVMRTGLRDGLMFGAGKLPFA